MNGRAFKLGTFARADGKPSAGIVLDDTAIHLARAYEAYHGPGRPAFRTTASAPGLNLQDLLPEWDANFAVLQEWNKSPVYSKTIALLATRIAATQ